MVEKELLVHVIAYNLVRSVMQQAAIRHQVDLERLSFKGAIDTLNHFADAVHAAFLGTFLFLLLPFKLPSGFVSCPCNSLHVRKKLRRLTEEKPYLCEEVNDS